MNDPIGEQCASCFQGETDMQPVANCIASKPYRRLVNYESAAQELQDLLSRGLAPLYRSAYRLLGNMADAEDAVQDALFSAYKHLDQFRGQSQMSTWLTTIVRNCARMQLRRRPRHIHMSLDERIGDGEEHSLADKLTDERPTPEDQCRSSEINARLSKFAARLSHCLRRTFQLRDKDDLSICETARILGVANGTVKAQLARARKKLRESMRQERKSQPRTVHNTPSPSIAGE